MPLGEQLSSSTHFHILSFEGPDRYSRAGGIATRITGLSEALASRDQQTHLWFVGDPALPGVERHGALALHRWCQWISEHHPGGVYDGEDAKSRDYAASLPPFLMETELRPRLEAGEHAVVLAEEWHTAPAVLHLDALLRAAGLRERVNLLWNANNTFGFERIDWVRLNAAATIVTVSRYMKHRMRAYGVDPVVIPNGLGPESFVRPDAQAVAGLRRRLASRLVLAKVARWDPDKRWLLAVDTVAELKKQGSRPLLVARGGMEAHVGEVLARGRAAGLRIVKRSIPHPGGRGLLVALEDVDEADIVVLDSHLDPAARSVLFRVADAVLANSGHEPFGLVGLEAMAVGGLACTGASGEDYAIDGQNALVLQQDSPHEFVALFGRVRGRPEYERRLRRSGMATARQYAWTHVVDRALLPRI
jgi:glycosyltransferase involved in cell wall biosynthesis